MYASPSKLFASHHKLCRVLARSMCRATRASKKKADDRFSFSSTLVPVRLLPTYRFGHTAVTLLFRRSSPEEQISTAPRFPLSIQPLPLKAAAERETLTLSSEEYIFVSVKAFASTCSSRVPQDKTATATDGTQTHTRVKAQKKSAVTYVLLASTPSVHVEGTCRALREASTGLHQAAVAARWRSTYRKCTQILLPF